MLDKQVGEDPGICRQQVESRKGHTLARRDGGRGRRGDTEGPRYPRRCRSTSELFDDGCRPPPCIRHPRREEIELLPPRAEEAFHGFRSQDAPSDDERQRSAGTTALQRIRHTATAEQGQVLDERDRGAEGKDSDARGEARDGGRCEKVDEWLLCYQRNDGNPGADRKLRNLKRRLR